MTLYFNQTLAKQYKKSSPQKIRVLSEAWCLTNVDCFNCGYGLHKFANNRKLADFYCPHCGEQYELKSSSRKWGNVLIAGAYQVLYDRLQKNDSPNFLFLHYSKQENYLVKELFCVPKQFMTLDLIKPRAALKKTAKRAGWIGSKIFINRLPASCKIYSIKNGQRISVPSIQLLYQETKFLNKRDQTNKNWLMIVMKLVEQQNPHFSLSDIYSHEADLQRIYPFNRNIRGKIRQQLQILRDEGVIFFKGNGHYRKLDPRLGGTKCWKPNT